MFKKRPFLVKSDKPIRLISLDDPAVDMDATDEAHPGERFRFALSTGMDRSKLVITGETTEFGVLPLTPGGWKACKCAAHAAVNATQARYLAGLSAFDLGCEFIEAVADDNGAAGLLERKDWPTYIEPDVMSEIGNYILKLSRNTEKDTPK